MNRERITCTATNTDARGPDKIHDQARLANTSGTQSLAQEEDYSGDLAGGNLSIGLATAFMNAGDTLQSASASVSLLRPAAL